MHAVFRADASHSVGTGHVMRCATLAQSLKQQGWHITFVCAALPGHLNHWLEEQGYDVAPLRANDNTPQTMIELLSQLPAADWLIVDHYALDAPWEKALRPAVNQIAVIDDLANRPHQADLLLDQNLDHSDADYRPLVNDGCGLLIGPRYALLREEFRQARAASRKPHSGQLNHLMINFGGSDPTQETEKTLTALQGLTGSQRPSKITVVVGQSFVDAAALQSRFHWPGLRFLQGVSHMAELLSETDLVIGGGGTTSWERCYMGVPSLIIAVAENQLGISTSLHTHGAARFLGSHTQVTPALIQEALLSLATEPRSLITMAKQAGALVDGLGVDRVVTAMTSPALSGSHR